VSGWEQPSAPDDGSPRTYWGQAQAPDPLSPGQLVRAGWRLYRSAPRRFLVVAAIPAAIQALLALPSFAAALELVEAMFRVLADYLERVAADPETYRNADPNVLQEELEAQLQLVLVPGSDLMAWSAIGGGLAMVVGLIGTAALTSTALASAAGRPIPATFAYRLIAARAGLVMPITILGIGWVVVSWLPVFLQSSPEFQTWAGAPGSPRSVLIASLLGVLGLIVVLAIVVLAVRWALYIPAVLVEALGVGPGLARAAQLTRGIRMRLAVAMIGLIVLLAIGVGAVAVIVGFAVGFGAGSVAAGFVAYVVAGLLGSLLTAPVVPAMLAHAYRERTRAADEPIARDVTPG
jgi:hypothetical protein